jgi:hypothetical protein
MTRIKFLGLAAVVVVAALGVLASSAGATTPAWFECAKAPSKNGKFNDKACTQKNETSTGKYELQEGVGKDKAFKGKGAAAKLEVETPYGNFPINCGQASTGGKPAPPNKETEVSFAFKKCEFESQSCKTPGGKKGEIKGSGLVAELGDVEPEEGKTPPAVGLKIVNPGGEKEPLASFECGEGEKAGFVKKSLLLGSVIGVVEKDVNVISKEQTLTYKALAQFKEHEFGGKKYKPLVNIVGFSSEVEKIEECAGLECTEEYPAHVIRGEFCGKFVENILGKECTPPTYAGLNGNDASKGEALMIKA